MKTTKKDFELFKKECRSWIDKLELNNWSVYFQHCAMKDRYGNTAMQYLDSNATIALTTTWDSEVRPYYCMRS